MEHGSCRAWNKFISTFQFVFNCVLVLCFIMGYVLPSGEPAHERVVGWLVGWLVGALSCQPEDYVRAIQERTVSIQQSGLCALPPPPPRSTGPYRSQSNQRGANAAMAFGSAGRSGGPFLHMICNHSSRLPNGSGGRNKRRVFVTNGRAVMTGRIITAIIPAVSELIGFDLSGPRCLSLN